MKKLILLTFITFTLFQNIYSQTDFRKGYIISNENDTISGLIDYREGIKKYKICDFKSSEDQNVINYTPSQIKGYRYLNDKYFTSKEITKDDNSKEKVFFEVLVKGKATLYKYNSAFYIEKNDEKFHKLTNELQLINQDGKEFYKYSNRHIAVLSYLLSDCPSLKGKINIVKNSEKDLSKLIELYNECVGEPSISFKEKKPWFKAHFGLSLGINSSKINFISSYREADHLTADFNRANSIMPSLYVDFLSPRVHERIALHLGVNYLTSTYKSFSTIESTFVTKRNEVTIDLKQLKIPLGFRYTFPERTITPYFNLGASYTINLESSALWVLESERNKVVNFFESEALVIGDSQIGFWGGIGVNKSILNNLNGFVEIRYEYAKSSFETIGEDYYDGSWIIDYNLTNFQLLIGLSF